MKIEEIRNSLYIDNETNKNTIFTINEIIKVFEGFNEFQLNKILNIYRWDKTPEGYNYIEIFVKGDSFVLSINQYFLGISNSKSKIKHVGVEYLKTLLGMYFKFGVLAID